MDRLFKSVEALEKGLDAYWARNQVIANNIANYNTPGFKASKVEFEEHFQAALEDGGLFQTKTTRDKHMEFSPSEFDAVVVQNTARSMRMDGNNVDVEYEMNEQAKNTIAYNLAVSKLNKQLMRLRTAITSK